MLAPGVKVETKTLTWDTGYQEIVKAFEDGTAPDVLELGSDMITEFASNNSLLDITDKTLRLRKRLIAWDPGMYEGKVYAIPWILDTRALFYNRRLMSNYNFDPTKPPETWSELVKTCRTIHNPFSGVYGIGINGPDPNVLYKKVLPFFWSNGGNILSSDGKKCILNSPENKEALEYYLSLISYGRVGTQKELDQMFMDDKLGFWISGSWLINRLANEASNVDYGVTLIPRADKDKGFHASFYRGEYLVINQNSKCPKYALSLAKYLTWEENTVAFCQALGRFFPAKTIKIDDVISNQPKLNFWRQLESAYSPPIHPECNQMKKIIDNEIGLAIDRKKSVDQSLRDSAQKIDALLK